MRVLDMEEQVGELNRINDLRGRSHGGEIPDADALAPEQLAGAILRGIVDDPGRVDS
jgi:hypothetical protein